MSASIDPPPGTEARSDAADDRLAWRIPHARSARPPFLADRRFWIVLLVWGVGLALVWTFDDPLRLIAAAGLTGFALLAWKFWRFRDDQGAAQAPHFRIDDGGLHWHDSTGAGHVFPVERLRAYRLGLDEDTVRPVVALTLFLADGQETQPIELAAPADAPAVRRLLAERLLVAERKDDDGERLAGYLRGRLLDRSQSPTVRRLARWAVVEPWNERGQWLLSDVPGQGKLFFDDVSGVWMWEDYRTEPLRAADLDDLVERLSERSNETDDLAFHADATARLRGVSLPAALKDPKRREEFLAWFAGQWDDDLPGDASDLTLRAEPDGPTRLALDGEWHGAESWFFQGAYDPIDPSDRGSLTISRFADLERSRQAFQRAAKTLGMLVRFQTDEGRWQFVGSREAFAEWVDWIESHSAAMKPREPGIRLPTFVWGSDPIRMSIQYSPLPYVEDGRLGGPEEFFAQLVEKLRTMLATWPVGKEAQVQLFPRNDPPFRLTFRERRIDELSREET